MGEAQALEGGIRRSAVPSTGINQVGSSAVL